MFTNNLRALATALVIGTATLGAVGLLTTTTAQAALRAVVGKPLLDAQAAANAGNYATANAKIREAEAASGKTAEESNAISQMKQFVASKSGDFSALAGTAAGAQAKFNADYNARRYSEVINAAEALRKFNLLNPTNQLVIAQAYWQSRNAAGCIRYLRQNFGGSANENVLKLMRSCAHDAGDARTEQSIMEQLVISTGKPEYWRIMLTQALRTRGLRDPQTLDIYRIRYLTGGMNKADEYMTLAQLAISVGLPKEAQTVVQKGIEAKVLVGERPKRLNAMAGERLGIAEAGLARALAAANAAPRGDALVKIGEYQNSMGKSAEAVKTIQAGIAKGVVDANFANVRLGIAQLDAKQRDAALRSFAAVKGDPAWTMVARLWSIYARRG